MTPVSRQYARLLARREKGLCGRCPARADVNPATGKPYTLCAACRQRKNATRALGPRVKEGLS